MRETIKFLAGMLFLFIAISCSNEDASIIDTSLDSRSSAMLCVPDTTREVTPELVERIAKRSVKSGLKGRSISTYTIDTYYSDDNNILAYVINYGQNEGYLIVSADKRTYPIIASSETGHMDIDLIKNTPISNWITNMSTIGKGEEIPDSIAVNIAREWEHMTYATQPFKLVSRSTGDEYIDNIISQAIAMWTAEGCEVIAAKDADVSTCPLEVANLINDIKERHNYDELEKTYILRLDNTETSKVNPMIKTKWTAYSPYNAAVPYNSNLNTTIVAVAQLLYYHNYPADLNVRSLPLELTSANPNDALPKFLVEVGKKCGYTFKPYEADSLNFEAASKGIAHYKYKFYKMPADRINIFSSLKNYGPILMSDQTLFYSWLCDGIDLHSRTTNYRVVTYTGDFADINPTLAFATRVNKDVYYYSAPGYHMVWGLKPQMDGYYYNSKWTVNFPGDPNTVYLEGISCLCDVTPSNQ